MKWQLRSGQSPQFLPIEIKPTHWIELLSGSSSSRVGARLHRLVLHGAAGRRRVAVHRSIAILHRSEGRVRTGLWSGLVDVLKQAKKNKQLEVHRYCQITT